MGKKTFFLLVFFFPWRDLFVCVCVRAPRSSPFCDVRGLCPPPPPSLPNTPPDHTNNSASSCGWGRASGGCWTTGPCCARSCRSSPWCWSGSGRRGRHLRSHSRRGGGKGRDGSLPTRGISRWCVCVCWGGGGMGDEGVAAALHTDGVHPWRIDRSIRRPAHFPPLLFPPLPSPDDNRASCTSTRWVGACACGRRSSGPRFFGACQPTCRACLSCVSCGSAWTGAGLSVRACLSCLACVSCGSEWADGWMDGHSQVQASHIPPSFPPKTKKTKNTHHLPP